MFDLETAIDHWVDTIVTTHPVLQSHADEIADHLLMHSLAEVDDGTSPEAALDLAIAALGPPGQLAAEFRRSADFLARLRCEVTVDTGQSTREQLLMAGAWIGFSLVWAAAMIRFEDNLNWMLVGWTMTTFLPLSALQVALRRRAARTTIS